MTEILDKRTTENVWYDFDCTNLLNAAETIQSITSITADQSGLTFGTPVINTAVITYPDNTTAAIGKVARCQIGGGIIPAGATEMFYTVRVLMTTNDGGNIREATTLLRIINNAT